MCHGIHENTCFVNVPFNYLEWWQHWPLFGRTESGTQSFRWQPLAQASMPSNIAWATESFKFIQTSENWNRELQWTLTSICFSMSFASFRAFLCPWMFLSRELFMRFASTRLCPRSIWFWKSETQSQIGTFLCLQPHQVGCIKVSCANPSYRPFIIFYFLQVWCHISAQCCVFVNSANPQTQSSRSLTVLAHLLVCELKM